MKKALVLVLLLPIVFLLSGCILPYDIVYIDFEIAHYEDYFEYRIANLTQMPADPADMCRPASATPEGFRMEGIYVCIPDQTHGYRFQSVNSDEKTVTLYVKTSARPDYDLSLSDYQYGLGGESEMPYTAAMTDEARIQTIGETDVFWFIPDISILLWYGFAKTAFAG